MKENIDLTENRDFMKVPTRSVHKELTAKKRSIIPFFKKKFPWDSDRLQNPEDEETGLLFTGDQKKRASKQRFHLRIENCLCERCGDNLSNKPYLMHYGLCNTCEEDLSYERLRSENSIFTYD